MTTFSIEDLCKMYSDTAPAIDWNTLLSRIPEREFSHSRTSAGPKPGRQTAPACASLPLWKTASGVGNMTCPSIPQKSVSGCSIRWEMSP